VHSRQFVNLPRRVYLTFKYRGMRSVLYRILTFPLRFTPLRRHLGIGPESHGDPAEGMRWYRSSGRPVAIVIPSYRDAERVAALVRSIRRTTDRDRVEIIVADDASGSEHLAALRRIDGIRIVDGEVNAGFATNVNRGIRAASPDADVVVVNSDVVATRGWLESLQYATTRHPRNGIIGPKLLYRDMRIQFGGTIRKPGFPEWFDHRFRAEHTGYGPANLPQPALAVTGACMYMKREVINEIGLLDEEYPMAFEDVDYCLRAWLAGYRVMYWPAAQLFHLESVTRGMELGERERASQKLFWDRWSDFFDARNVRATAGKLRVIYVTEDTGVGGGHRDVFEHLNRLQARGHEVELWTLAGPPDWFELEAPVRTFSDYEALTAALSPVEAIKVATWWATAGPVWEASVVHGIPVYFVQDIETSYYPDSPELRDAVVASYRPEFRYMTISSWNREQLRKLGAHATLVPPGIDLANFRPLPDVARRSELLLGLGRSNPLKNLGLTLAAWRSLPEPRPELCLFGIEPELAAGEPGIRYVESPSDAEVNSLLNEATCFVQTSTHEGFCLPPLEAMATGCPVICTDAHGNRDFCRDDVNCLMPAGDRRSVSRAMARLLAEPGLRERLGAAGIETAAGYAWSRRIDALEGFLNEVAAQRPADLLADALHAPAP
jgi:GT2 family glycosyltransferase